ncbi:MAG: transposase [Chloroflexia bacterium]|nr:transposase [Chloroflexia bacterium]
MKQCSVDLRERRLGAIDAGLSQAPVFRRFGVGTSTNTRWQQQRQDTGRLSPKPQMGRRPAIGPVDGAKLRAQVARRPDATLAEYGVRWASLHGIRVSVATTSRAIHRTTLSASICWTNEHDLPTNDH